MGYVLNRLNDTQQAFLGATLTLLGGLSTHWLWNSGVAKSLIRQCTDSGYGSGFAYSCIPEMSVLPASILVFLIGLYTLIDYLVE